MELIGLTDTSITKEDEVYWLEYLQGYNEIPGNVKESDWKKGNSRKYTNGRTGSG